MSTRGIGSECGSVECGSECVYTCVCSEYQSIGTVLATSDIRRVLATLEVLQYKLAQYYSSARIDTRATTLFILNVGRQVPQCAINSV